MHRNPAITRTLTAALAVAAIALGAVVTLSPAARAQDDAQASAAKSMTVGTYKPRQVFQAYPGRGESMKKMRDLRSQAQQAQQQGDQKKMQELSRQMQQAQQSAVQKFRDEVDEVLPKVAKSENVDVVAVQVAYSAEGVQTKDLTKQIVEELGGEMPQNNMRQMMQRGAKQQQQGQGQGKGNAKQKQNR